MSFETGDVARVTAKMEFQGEDQQNRYYVKNLSAGTLDDASAYTEIAARIDAAHAELQPQMHEDLDYTTIEVFNVTQDAPMDEAPWPTLTQGAISLQDPLPAQTSGLVLFPTKTARSQGRKYVGGMIEGDSFNGVPDTDILDAMADYAAVLLTTWLVGGGEFQIGNYTVLTARFSAWISSIVRSVFRTQRRRAKGVGS